MQPRAILNRKLSKRRDSESAKAPQPPPGAADSEGGGPARATSNAQGEDDGHEYFFSAGYWPNEEDPDCIALKRVPEVKAIPPSMRQLNRDIDDVARVIATVFAHHPTPRKGLFQALRDTADVGLVGARHSVNTGIDDLDYVKNHIADQFPVVRSYFWNQYLRFMAWGILLFAGGGIAYSQLPAEGAYPLALTIVISAFWIPFGILVGLFLEYAYRVDAEIPFDKLREINPGRWDPLQRFVNTVITGAVFAILLGTKVFTVGVGSLVLNDFVGKQPYLSLVIGFFTGFATPYVQDLIRQVRPANKNPSTAATGRGGDGHDAQDGHRT